MADIEEIKKAQKEGKIEDVTPQETPSIPLPQTSENPQGDLSRFISLIQTLRKPVSSAPTFIPKNFLEQIQFYENGGTYRVYFYVNKAWKYTTLS